MFRRLCCFILITAVLSEPECSRYHYEEQTLNKVIRQEIAMEKLKSDMAATQQHVLDAINEIKETTQQLKDGLNNAETRIERVEDDVGSIADAAIKKYSSKGKGLSVVFRSMDLTDLKRSTGETLVFKSTRLNEGLGYNNISGVFTAPVAGTYAFSIQLCVKSGHNLHYEIVSDDILLKRGLFYDARGASCYNSQTFALLKEGSKVHVKCTSGSGSLLTSSFYWNTFSGALV